LDASRGSAKRRQKEKGKKEKEIARPRHLNRWVSFHLYDEGICNYNIFTCKRRDDAGQQTVTGFLDTDKSDIVEAVLTLGVKNPASIQNPPYPISLFRQH